MLYASIIWDDGITEDTLKQVQKSWQEHFPDAFLCYRHRTSSGMIKRLDIEPGLEFFKNELRRIQSKDLNRIPALEIGESIRLWCELTGFSAPIKDKEGEWWAIPPGGSTHISVSDDVWAWINEKDKP